MKIKDIILLKCPRCHEGDLFHGKAYSSHMIDMPQRCEKCKQPFFLEPGFYYGAMFVSYAINVAIVLILFVIIWAILGFKQLVFMKAAFTAMGATILLFPYTLRISRAIWLGFFYKDKLTYFENTTEIITDKKESQK